MTRIGVCYDCKEETLAINIHRTILTLKSDISSQLCVHRDLQNASTSKKEPRWAFIATNGTDEIRTYNGHTANGKPRVIMTYRSRATDMNIDIDMTEKEATKIWKSLVKETEKIAHLCIDVIPDDIVALDNTYTDTQNKMRTNMHIICFTLPRN